jgi:hypothetical protein
VIWDYMRAHLACALTWRAHVSAALYPTWNNGMLVTVRSGTVTANPKKR